MQIMDKPDFEKIRDSIKSGDYIISIHASKRLRNRQLTIADLEHAILNGEIIERDPEAKPYPKCIFLGEDAIKGEALHVVCSLTPGTQIVTVYFPEEDMWSKDRVRK
jgi:hypothetical protein